MQSPELTRGFAEALKADWHALARPNQLPPQGDWWRIWLVLAGRGFGKTRTGAEWVRSQAESGMAKRIALVAPTAGDARDVMIEGESGILAISLRWNKPTYEPTKRRLTWPNGVMATAYSADEAERLRGPQHDAAWCDELGAWRYPESWDMLMLGLRLGKNPRCIVTTTPKPTKLIRELVAREGKDVVISRGKTSENAANLAPQFLETIVSRYSGTRLGRQELEGELLTDTPGALWSVSVLEATRVASAPPLQRIVVAIDPSGSGGEGADECGIGVAGLGQNGHGYVLSDLSGLMAPPEWARLAIDAYRAHQADRIVAEINYGGAMVTATIAAVDSAVPVKTITSSRGKVLRAEPISALFEQGRAHLVGAFPELEDEMTSFTADYNRARDGSPNRVDALVFALTELMCGLPVGGFFRESALLVDGTPVEVPRCPTCIIAVIGTSAKIGPECDGIGVVYLARSQLGGSAPLTIIDWTLEPFEGVTWLASVWERLELLRKECRAQTHRGGLWIEGTPIGAALLAHGVASQWDVHPVPPEALPADLAARAAGVSGFVGSGDVKMARPAHEKLMTFRGVTKNHLLSQVLGFGVTEQSTAAELLTALCAGIVLTLAERRPRVRSN
jgi:predicted phage terminase large subunit-like protein